MKKLFLVFAIAACGKATNGAEFMVQAQAPKATCESTVLKGIDVTVCDVPAKDKIVQFVGAYQKGRLPFQVYPLSDGSEKAPAPTPPPPAGQGSGANAPTPDAGVTDGK